MGRRKRLFAELTAVALTVVLVCGCVFQWTGMKPDAFSMTAHIPSEGTTWQVNLNTASAETLMALPGIGQTLADRIVAYREENGPFAAPEDLIQVPGIGEKTFANMKDYLTVEEQS